METKKPSKTFHLHIKVKHTSMFLSFNTSLLKQLKFLNLKKKKKNFQHSCFYFCNNQFQSQQDRGKEKRTTRFTDRLLHAFLNGAKKQTQCEGDG